MPTKIVLINKRSNIESRLTFSHALRLLILDKEQKRDTYTIKGKYIFNGSDIIRYRDNKESPEPEK